jgi:hypothetical protein
VTRELAAEPLATAEAEAEAEAAAILTGSPVLQADGARPTAELPPAAASPSPVPAESVHDRGLDHVAVASLRLERGGIGDATADEVQVRMGGIGRLDAEHVFVQFGGVGSARADVLDVRWGGVGPTLAGEVRVTQGVAGNVLAREATVDQAFVRTLIAQRVTVTRPSAALVVLAGRVDGQVRALLDWRGALALGVGLGLMTALSRVLRKGR